MLTVKSWNWLSTLNNIRHTLVMLPNYKVVFPHFHNTHSPAFDAIGVTTISRACVPDVNSSSLMVWRVANQFEDTLLPATGLEFASSCFFGWIIFSWFNSFLKTFFKVFCLIYFLKRNGSENSCFFKEVIDADIAFSKIKYTVSRSIQCAQFPFGRYFIS